MKLFGTQHINSDGQLVIGGVNATDIAAQFGTPVIVYDIEEIRRKARLFIQAFQQKKLTAQVAYASKAFSSIAMYEVVNEEGLSLDVVSGGELYTALAAKFPRERIHFHGNNKSIEELTYAIQEGIGCIVVDNFYEIELIEKITNQYQTSISILLRVTPGIEAHTHEYITTGQEESKFGFDLMNGQADEALTKCLAIPSIQVLGVHSHIGSQIFDSAAFSLAAKKLLSKMHEWKVNHQFSAQVLNVGGGFGIRYTEEDEPLEPHIIVEDMCETIVTTCQQIDFPLPEIWIEPGRSIVGEAGTTLYSIGSQKEVPNKRHYLAVDGGMSDNIRPALYDARYEARIANKMMETPTKNYTIAGKCCESGDQLIDRIHLPEAVAGDILAIFCTGAYGYSMASNYNRITRPAVVFVENGQAVLVIRRESYEDLLRNELSYSSPKKEATS